MKLAIKLHDSDNVATAMDDLEGGEVVSILSDRGTEVDQVTVATPVPLPFHKVALVEIGEGEPVLKYGEIIGYATASIERGGWVHTHNVHSASLVGSRPAE